jgi:uncharacterized membrane protein YjfL (UPF0719 family)
MKKLNSLIVVGFYSITALALIVMIRVFAYVSGYKDWAAMASEIWKAGI